MATGDGAVLPASALPDYHVSTIATYIPWDMASRNTVWRIRGDTRSNSFPPGLAGHWIVGLVVSEFSCPGAGDNDTGLAFYDII